MIEALISVVGAGLLGVIGWAFHFNSRVAVLEADRVGLRELIAAKLDLINMRLARIEKTLDREAEE